MKVPFNKLHDPVSACDGLLAEEAPTPMLSVIVASNLLEKKKNFSSFLEVVLCLT